ncbi:MAG: DNA polymerase III subunit alpha [Armatimonadota bacterium]|nr:DNA polymerase III subunit alpha [Armatimonadota bacterium]
MSKPFVHIHNHTEYSLLDGMQRIGPMVERAKELGQPALAITDHGAMYGALEFYLECKARGVKPIIGMEAYVAPEGRLIKAGREEKNTYHLLLLAKNDIGYKNLAKLATISSLEGFYYKPRIDHEVLREHAEGLIGTTTCIGSEINQYLLAGDYEKAKRTAELYKEIFGHDSFFVELQNHKLKEQEIMQDGLLRIAKELDLPLVCTNDSHYMCKGEYDAHNVLICIQTNRKVSEDRMFANNEFYLKSEEEMRDVFSDFPEAISNSGHIAELCDVTLGSSRVELPDPDVPEGKTSGEHMIDLARRGLEERFDTLTELHWERLGYELDIIGKTGFEKYFLLVREFANFTREQGIYYGVRGSAAGSLVSYCLGITDVDPIEYDLTFERFLNPERIAMPDIDMDFEDARRDEVIRYVRNRFGEDRVAQIITFGTLGAKAAIRDAGRVMGRNVIEVDRICKTIPTIPGFTIADALEKVPEFKQAYAENPETKALVDTARSIEGICRNAGVHAAGVVISKNPLIDVVPLTRGNDGQTVTQFPMNMLEKCGLLKMDFLGLSNLTVLARAVENIRAAGKGEIDILNLPMGDEKAYQLLAEGNTVGIFQLEGGGMTRYVQSLKPQSIHELAAMVALYRPGPMDHIDTYIAGKHGRRQPKYLDDRMEPFLRETFGVIVYQDQVLQIVRALAGFTLGEADVLRKAMGKKDAEIMGDSQAKFVEGAVERGMDQGVAEQVFELLRPFAGYAFNKAHAVCYAMIAYQTAYLKANYPVEFMAALLGVYRGKEDRVVGCIDECRRMQIDVLQPDVNKSHEDFTIEIEEDRSKIRFGLGAIKGIGEAAIVGLLKAREDGPFSHIYELAERGREQGGLNRVALDALIKAGALDSIDPNRKKLLAILDTAIAFAEQANRDKAAGQDSLFGGDGEPGSVKYPNLPEIPPATRQENLAMEKEVTGLYLSDHPLKGFERAVQRAASHAVADIAEMDDGAIVTLAGVVAGIRQIRTKSKNELMATVTLEDMTGQAAITVFPSAFAQYAPLLGKDRLIVVKGALQHRDVAADGTRRVEVISRAITQLEGEDSGDSGEDHSNGSTGTIRVQVLRATHAQLRRVRELIDQNPGSFQLTLEVGSNGSTMRYDTSYRVSDGPWVTELRRTLDLGFVHVMRHRDAFAKHVETAQV